MQTVKAGVNKRRARTRDQIDKILHTICNAIPLASLLF